MASVELAPFNIFLQLSSPHWGKNSKDYCQGLSSWSTFRNPNHGRSPEELRQDDSQHCEEQQQQEEEEDVGTQKPKTQNCNIFARGMWAPKFCAAKTLEQWQLMIPHLTQISTILFIPGIVGGNLESHLADNDLLFRNCRHKWWSENGEHREL